MLSVVAALIENHLDELGTERAREPTVLDDFGRRCPLTTIMDFDVVQSVLMAVKQGRNLNRPPHGAADKNFCIFGFRMEEWRRRRPVDPNPIYTFILLSEVWGEINWRFRSFGFLGMKSYSCPSTRNHGYMAREIGRDPGAMPNAIRGQPVKYNLPAGIFVACLWEMRSNMVLVGEGEHLR